MLRAVFGTGDLARAKRALDVYLDAIGQPGAPVAEDVVRFVTSDEAAGCEIEQIDSMIFESILAASVATAAITRAQRDD